MERMLAALVTASKETRVFFAANGLFTIIAILGLASQSRCGNHRLESRVRENRTHGSEVGNGSRRFRPLSEPRRASWFSSPNGYFQRSSRLTAKRAAVPIACCGSLTLRLVELLLLSQAVEVQLRLIFAVLVLEKFHLLLALQFADLLLLARLVLLALDLIDLQLVLQPLDLEIVLELIQLPLSLLGLGLVNP